MAQFMTMSDTECTVSWGEEDGHFDSHLNPRRNHGNVECQSYPDQEVSNDNGSINPENCGREIDRDLATQDPLVVVKHEKVDADDDRCTETDTSTNEHFIHQVDEKCQCDSGDAQSSAHEPMVVVKEEAPDTYHDITAITLPDGLIIKQSTIPGTGKGVWTTEPLSKGQSFGPYEGEGVTNVQDNGHAQEATGSCWEIYKDGKLSHYIDAGAKPNAKWMHFVNTTSSEGEQNMVPCQHEGQGYFRILRDIPANTELLTLYGEGQDPISGFSRQLRMFNEHGLEDSFHENVTMVTGAKDLNGASSSQLRNEDRLYNGTPTIIGTLGHVKAESSDSQSHARMDLSLNTCPICNENIARSEDLQNHLSIHMLGKPYKCNTCGEGFARSDLLQKHIRIHKGEKPYKCTTCRKSFRYLSNFQKHSKLHQGVVYPIPGMGFSHKDEFRIHMQTRTEEKPYKCTACGKGFRDVKHFQEHSPACEKSFGQLKVLHSRMETDTTETTGAAGEAFTDQDSLEHVEEPMKGHSVEKSHLSVAGGKSSDQAQKYQKHVKLHKEKNYKCPTCGEAFHHLKILKKHLKTHARKKSFKCPTCDKCFGQSRFLQSHLKTHAEEKTHSCHICEEGFMDRNSLKEHKKSHRVQKGYLCSSCGKSFNRSQNLKKHMKIHKEKPHECHACGKGFKESSDLKTHISRIHNGEKPYMCSTCGKDFDYLSHYQNHLRIHTGEKPFKCSTCDKCFGQSTDLHRHMKTHSDEKPHVCASCGKAFNRSSNLRTHMRLHTGEKPHTCPTCGEGFAYLSIFQKHLSIHTGEKPHKCSICDKSFFLASDFSRHIITHTEEKPFICPTCGKGFNRVDNLKKHMIIHTGKTPYLCATCGKGFNDSSNLHKHIRSHAK